MAKTTKTLKLTFLNGKNKKTSVTLGMQQIILLRNKFAVR